MIVLKSLAWDHMFCYGVNNRLDLQESNVTQIIGKNGAGKSSINLVLEELLYNKNSKGIKKADILNRDSGADHYFAEAELEVNGTQYQVSLTRKGVTSKLVLLKDGEDISAHTATNTYKELAKILGDDFSTFSQKVYQGMTSSLQFLTATDAARKKFLISLLDLTEYSEYEAQLKEYSTGLAGEIKALETSASNLATLIASAEKHKDLDESPICEVTVADPQLPEDLIDLKVSEKSIKLHNVAAERRIELVRLIVANHNTDKPLDKTPRDVSELTMLIADEVSARKPSAALILKMKKLSDHCPTCEEKIDTAKVSALIKTHTTIIEESNGKEDCYKEFKKEAERINRHNGAILTSQTQEETYQKELDTLSEATPTSIGELLSKIAAIKAAIALERAEIDDLTAANAKAHIHNAKIVAAQEQWTEISESFVKEASRLESLKLELGKLEVLKKAFSSKGIVAFKIESLVKDLENSINEYLIEFSEGRFSLHFVLDGDKLNIVVVDKGKEVSIQALSSGELARVNISTVLAIRKLMSSNSQNNINLLFLDEITNVLDIEGRDKLVEILMREPLLNTFIISHGWQHPLVNRLEVIKNKYIAYIQEA